MTVVDFGAKLRGVGRNGGRLGWSRTAADDATSSTVREAASPSSIRGLGVVSTNAGSAAVSGAVMPHPLDQADVVAFLLVEGSEAAMMLESARTAEFSFERDGPGGSFAGSVELIRANQVQAASFRSLVGEIFAAVGGTAADLAVHEATIGIPSTLVAFLHPEPGSDSHETGSAVAHPAPSTAPQGRRVGHLVLIQGGRAD